MEVKSAPKMIVTLVENGNKENLSDEELLQSLAEYTVTLIINISTQI